MSKEKQRVAIVTGAGRGIGRATALRLAREGMAVALAARTAPELDETRRLIEAGGGRASAICADVSREEDVAGLVEQAARLGRIDTLVNNAGYVAVGSPHRLPVEEFDRIMAVNVRSVFLACRAVRPHLVGAGGGAIINVASLSATDPFPGLEIYGAAKAFVVALTRSLAREGINDGIRVYGVAPGAVETRMLREHFPDVPARDTLDPDEVAALIARMAAADPRYVSGETVWIQQERGTCSEGVLRFE